LVSTLRVLSRNGIEEVVSDDSVISGLMWVH
jgi:hypothetical protein